MSVAVGALGVIMVSVEQIISDLLLRPPSSSSYVPIHHFLFMAQMAQDIFDNVIVDASNAATICSLVVDIVGSVLAHDILHKQLKVLHRGVKKGEIRLIF